MATKDKIAHLKVQLAESKKQLEQQCKVTDHYKKRLYDYERICRQLGITSLDETTKILHTLSNERDKLFDERNELQRTCNILKIQKTFLLVAFSFITIAFIYLIYSIAD